MRVTSTTKKIISHYTHENVGVRSNLMKMLGQGKLGGTGRMIILPVDQGFEHGPDRSFAVNPPAYDPNYHHQLAIDAGLSAYAAPLGLLQTSSDSFYGQIPTILKINSSNTLANSLDQAVTGSIDDALKLGCAAIGFTIYPGSEMALDMISDIQEIAVEAKDAGLAVVVWSYPRGGNISKEGETAIDIVSYAAHMAALVGAHIIKVKPPTSHIELEEAKKVYESENIPIEKLSDRIRHVVQSCFQGRRLVVFSGGTAKDEDSLLKEIKDLYLGGASGSIIGRNSFQRKYDDALSLLNKITTIYKGK